MSSVNRIAIIEPIGGHGGMDLYDYGLCSGIAEHDVQVHFFTSEETTTREVNNVTTYSTFKQVWSTRNKLLRLLKMIKGLKESIRKIKSLEIQLVHIHFFDLKVLNLLILQMLKKAKLKVVLTQHDIESFHGSTISSIEKACFNRVDSIIVHNKICRDHLQLKCSDVPIHIIPHGSYLKFITPVLYDENKTREVIQLLFFGQIKEVKGLELILEALSLMGEEKNNFHLTIAGRPWHTNPSKYEDMIVSLGIQENVTTRFEYIPNNELPMLFDYTDLVILPYKKIYQSGVLLLSMSYGKPCLTSNLAAFEEIIKDGVNGFTFETENPNSLKNKLVDIYDQKNTLKPIVESANKSLETEYNWTTIGEKIVSVYESIQ